ncbi:MAG: RNA polymerase sigma factor [Planctomycetota bacterium]
MKALLDMQTDPLSSVAFNQAVAEHSEGLLNYALRMLRDADQAEDVTQDAFLALYRHIHQVPPNAFRPWLYRVTRNLCLDVLRRRKFKLRLFRDVGRDEDYEPTAVDQSEGRPDQLAEAREAQDAIEDAISQLPPKFRDAFVLCEMQGLSYEDAAEVLGCPVKTVSTRLFRARQRFRAAVSTLIDV